MERESLSFEVEGMRYVSAGDSERKRARMQFYPPQSELRHSSYETYARWAALSSVPKRIFIRNEDNFRVVDPKQLKELMDKPRDERTIEFRLLAAEMYSAEEVIIEDANPQIIDITNLPQAIFEPLEAAA